MIINNSKVMPRQFRSGDLVMRKAHQYEMENKLSPKWTGSFRITEVLGNGAYHLECHTSQIVLQLKPCK